MPASAADEGVSSGQVRVAIAAPEGVPANVRLDGKTDYVAGKPPAGQSITVALTLPVGSYHVDLPSVTFNGVRYIGSSSRPEVVVRSGGTTSLEAGYVAEEGSRQLHAMAISQTGLTLTWSAPPGSRFSLRRTSGDSGPAPNRSGGVEVPTNGSSAVDQGLAPGTTYSYSLFTQNKSRWYGPLVVAVRTTPTTGASDATYIAPPTTLLAKAADLASVTTTGTGVQVVLREGLPAPLLGSGVVLPISETLPGGFLGVVEAIAADGQTILLRAGGLSDAFDYYDLDVKEFSVEVGDAPTPASKTSLKAVGRVPVSAAPLKAAAPAAALSCNAGGGTDRKVEFSSTRALDGHFKTTMDKYHFLGVDVPTGFSVDMGLTAKVTGAASIESNTSSFECKINLPKLYKTISVVPVPMSILWESKAEFSIGVGLKVSNVGLSASAGVQVATAMSLKNGGSVSGKAVLNAAPLIPKIVANGKVGLKVGGELSVGPGVVSDKAGVIAGINGELYPVDAGFKPYFSIEDSRFNACTETEVAFTRALSMVAKAWLGNWSSSQKITADFLTAKTPYFGSPWYLPNGCQNISGSPPPDTLYGPGVTKIDDTTVGASGQWGYTEGFAPGKKAWVLTTGLLSDAIGSPDQFANTDIGSPGDTELTDSAGYPTYDAAAYQVTLIPAGTTLHIRYVFASEEYPEYVGSAYNDVMAVYVNGQNCAHVPGGTDPVAINTINDHINSDYYVDNSTGAAGYSTSMDGLTVPLTCSVPVTPGKAVTVKIAVADTSDHFYDSAVALVDGGIWTD